jgi:L-amino acid N-acyltransferase YncA
MGTDVSLGSARNQVQITPNDAMKISIETMLPGHWPAVRTIYVEGIETRNATFETEPPTWEAWSAAHLETCRIVALEGDEMLGWGALSPVSGRCVYRGVAEVSVYIGARSRGRGVGGVLLDELVRRSEEEGLWTLQARVFPENVASLVLHERCGFRRVGVRERIGRLDEIWRDVVLLERRMPRG